MYKISLILIFLISSFSYGQISIDNTTYSTTNLIDGVLVPSGSGTTVSNVQFRGCLNISNRYQAGYFSTATTTATQMGFSEGIVLSTGNTSDIPLGLGVNPGSVGQMSRNYTSGSTGEIRSSNPPSGQDADVNTLIAPENYYNAAILEFDFVPVSSSVSFRYIFGSEEYDDQSGSAFGINYNCSSYNDKFAFLISGPGISGGQGYQNDALNIARLTNSSEVGINSVNNGVVGSSGGFPNASNCSGANSAWINNTATPEFQGFIDGTELNGNTEILVAYYDGLTAGMTYHIRLIISDANDGAYDSVVYLEAGSFTTDPGGLPVEFIELNGNCSEEGIQLEWSTASERNNDYFVIERSPDLENFEAIDTISGQGNTSLLSEYQWADIHPLENTSYYRLSQTDYDGKKTLLQTVAVQQDCQTDNQPIATYNNYNQQLIINPNGKYIEELRIVDTRGQEVKHFVIQQSQKSLTSINLSEKLQKGVYIVSIHTSGGQYSNKIIVL